MSLWGQRIALLRLEESRALTAIAYYMKYILISKTSREFLAGVFSNFDILDRHLNLFSEVAKKYNRIENVKVDYHF
ncbi:MAG: hypothetical protein Tsb0014_15270 [Pleurocapsa sp.]